MNKAESDRSKHNTAQLWSFPRSSSKAPTRCLQSAYSLAHSNGTSTDTPSSKHAQPADTSTRQRAQSSDSTPIAHLKSAHSQLTARAPAPAHSLSRQPADTSTGNSTSTQHRHPVFKVRTASRSTGTGKKHQHPFLKAHAASSFLFKRVLK